MTLDLWRGAGFDLERFRERLQRLASRRVYIGTSSWKYRGWCGQIYDEARYVYHGKFSEKRFEDNCLAEYAAIFKTVCVDAAYYDYPHAERLAAFAREAPEDFRFAFKVTDELTIRRFPALPRFGHSAGQANPNYLNGQLFTDKFLAPCAAIRQRIAALIFEFSHFSPADYSGGEAFIEDLDRFLGVLPKGWPYAIEFRNRQWLGPHYFDCLARHQVAHTFNSWEAMPPLEEQLWMPGSRTNPELVVARLLLKPGRKYAEAKETFQPYDRTHEVNASARAGAAELAREGAEKPERSTYIYVNNRLEGNAPNTIEGILDALDE